MIVLKILFSLSMIAAVKTARTVQAISNLSDGRVIVSVEDGASRSLKDLGLSDLKSKDLPFPELDQEEIMGLFLGTDGVLMISQWTAGGGKFPVVRYLDLKTSKWKTVGKLSCVSFDTVAIDLERLTATCEADPQRETTEGPVSIALPGVAWKMNAVLPRTAEKNSKFAVTLNGPMFHWTSIDVSQGKKKKTLKAADL